MRRLIISLALSVLLVSCAAPETLPYTNPATQKPDGGKVVLDDGEYRVIRFQDGQHICYLAEQNHLRVAPSLYCLQ
jgi:hypothetical protein